MTDRQAGLLVFHGALSGRPLHVLVFIAFVFSVLALLPASVLFAWGTCRALFRDAV